MRLALILALALPALGACSVDSDSANEQMTIEYNKQRIRDAAAATARGARDVGAAAGNVAATTGRAIGNEVGDVDVDVDVRRRRAETAANDAVEAR
ncbi:MAG TPA: hypothetical protein VF605_06675 [Allosphingosinicella sp.]|jgi:hypothetical protein